MSSCGASSLKENNMTNPFLQVPKDVWEQFQKEIVAADLEYVDNYRAMRVRDDFLKSAYDKAEDDGCCGYFDRLIMDSNYDDWLVGCNHGH